MNRGEIALLGVTCLWGSTFVLVKGALSETSTLVFLACRFAIATLTLLVFYRGRLLRAYELNPSAARGGIYAGLCLAAGFMFQTSGLRYTTPSRSAFITGLTTVTVPLLGAAVYRKWPRPAECIGGLVATVGMGLMTLEGERFGLGKGELLTLGCTIAYGIHVLVLSRYSPKGGVELLSFLQIATAAAVTGATFWWAEAPRVVWSPAVVRAMLVTGMLGTALAFTVMAWAQQKSSPARISVIFAFEPVAAAVTSYLVLGEILSRQALVGAALILAGILLVELKPAAAAEHQQG